MSNIGIIVRANQDVAQLGDDWVPQPLGARADVLAKVQRYIPADGNFLLLHVQVEPTEESESPRTISVSGHWGPRESAALKQLCASLGARFYDAAAGQFVEL
jgi:hypothetical protein